MLVIIRLHVTFFKALFSSFICFWFPTFENNYDCDLYSSGIILLCMFFSCCWCRCCPMHFFTFVVVLRYVMCSFLRRLKCYSLILLSRLSTLSNVSLLFAVNIHFNFPLFLSFVFILSSCLLIFQRSFVTHFVPFPDVFLLWLTHVVFFFFLALFIPSPLLFCYSFIALLFFRAIILSLPLPVLWTSLYFQHFFYSSLMCLFSFLHLCCTSFPHSLSSSMLLLWCYFMLLLLKLKISLSLFLSASFIFPLWCSS